MNYLIIDSTDEQLAIVLLKKGIRYPYMGEKGARRHASTILVAIDNLLNSANLSPSQIDVIGVVVGPGSFTGIRIGVSTANAMAMATGAKLIELTSLEIFAYGKDAVLSVLDCKHDNYYALVKKDNEHEYLAITQSDFNNFSLPIVYKAGINIDNMVELFKFKLSQNDFVNKARPFYIKKSSAEY